MPALASIIKQACRIDYCFQNTLTGIRVSQPVGYVLVDRLISKGGNPNYNVMKCLFGLIYARKR